jgi:hypothetical protein
MRTAHFITPIKRLLAIVAAIAAGGLMLAIPTDAGAASILLDNGSLLNSSITISAVGSGVGFASVVQVSVATQLTAFGSYFCMPAGGHAKFMIWDGTNTTLLLSDTLAVSPAGDCSLLTQGSLMLDTLASPLTLNIGTYFFGEIFDNGFGIASTTLITDPPPHHLQFAFDIEEYSNFPSPAPKGPLNSDVLGLQLQGTQGATAVPEPATLTLTVLGLAAGIRRWRRQRPFC